jgi:WhiB family redox-sensing transcriptional regulator
MTLKGPWEFTEPACAQVGTTFFYLKDLDDPDQGMEEGNYLIAKKICDTCIHKIECAQWGIANETHGVWGGLTPKERRSLKRGRSAHLLESPSQ